MRSADAIRTRCKMLEIVRPFMQKHRFRVFHRLNIFLANQIHACSKAAMTDISRSPTHLALCVTDLSIFLTVCNSVLWTPVNNERIEFAVLIHFQHTLHGQIIVSRIANGGATRLVPSYLSPVQPEAACRSCTLLAAPLSNPEPFITYIGAVFGSAAYSSDTLLRTTNPSVRPLAYRLSIARTRATSFASSKALAACSGRFHRSLSAPAPRSARQSLRPAFREPAVGLFDRSRAWYGAASCPPLYPATTPPPAPDHM